LVRWQQQTKELPMRANPISVFHLKRRPVEPEVRQGKITKFRDLLEQEGHVHLEGAAVVDLLERVSLHALGAAADAAPQDPYGQGMRRRFYRTATLYPWTGNIRFDDPFIGANGVQFVPYYQPRAINGDADGKERRFAPLPDELEKDATLLAMIRLFFSLLPGDMIERRLPARVGLHLIRLFSDGRRIALPSPNSLHTDGEPWTAIVLLDRVNVSAHSAKSFVASRHCRGKQPQEIDPDDVLVEKTLTETLETIIIDDARVSHAVTGCLGANSKPGWRTTLLIDFSSLHPFRTA
jgi:hypothetical protein